MICSSRAGSACPSPRTIECGCGSVAAPSSSEVTSTWTNCPADGFWPSTGSQVAFCSRSFSTCSSSCSSVTGATWRASVKPPVVVRAISGRTSTWSSNSIGPPSSNFRLRTDGSAIGLRDSDSRA